MKHLPRDSIRVPQHVGQEPARGRRDRGRLSLDEGDRQDVLLQLEEILARTQRLDEHLSVAAARVGASCSPWTEEQLEALCRAAKALARAVRAAPSDGA